MLDALSHLPLFASPDEARAHLERSAADGVTDVVTAGTDPRLPESFHLVGALAGASAGVASTPRVHRAFGIHPQQASDEARDQQLGALTARLDVDGAVAIGECGIDHRPGQPPLDVQERTLRAQLAIARARGLPVILHIVRSWSRVLDIIDEDGPLPGGGVWHAFAGPREAIARAQPLGLVLSIGGLVFNPYAQRLQEALPHVPPELLVVETDMPHVPPVRLAAVVDELARLRGEDRAAVADRTRANALRIFRIPG